MVKSATRLVEHPCRLLSPVLVVLLNISLGSATFGARECRNMLRRRVQGLLVLDINEHCLRPSEDSSHLAGQQQVN